MKGLLKKWRDFMKKAKEERYDISIAEAALEILQLRRGIRPGNPENTWESLTPEEKVGVGYLFADLMEERGFLFGPEYRHQKAKIHYRREPENLQLSDVLPSRIPPKALEEALSRLM